MDTLHLSFQTPLAVALSLFFAPNLVHQHTPSPQRREERKIQPRAAVSLNQLEPAHGRINPSFSGMLQASCERAPLGKIKLYDI